MALLGCVYRPTFQQFVSEDYQPLASLPIHVCPETNERYVLWSNIQDAFEGVTFLRYWSTTRVLFMITQNGELYVLGTEQV